MAKTTINEQSDSKYMSATTIEESLVKSTMLSGGVVRVVSTRQMKGQLRLRYVPRQTTLTSATSLFE